MLCPRYDESSCQSYELLYHLIGPEKNVKSLKDSGWSPFLSKISSVFEVFLPMIPIQTLIRRLATKANISYYCWTLITSNQGWIEVLRMKKEGEKYRETQVSRTGATCLNQRPCYAPGLATTTGFEVSVADLWPHGAPHGHLWGWFLAKSK